MFRRSLFLFLALSLPVLAQEDVEEDALPPENGRRTRYQAVSHIDFEKLDVLASLEGPSLDLLAETKREGFNPLIRLRADFGDMMEQSVDEVR
jgi:hypothetical protein